MSNPFLDPNDGHVLADDMEKNREAKEYGHAPPPQPNPFTSGLGVPIMSPALGFGMRMTGQLIGPLPRTEIYGGVSPPGDSPTVVTNR